MGHSFLQIIYFLDGSLFYEDKNIGIISTFSKKIEAYFLE